MTKKIKIAVDAMSGENSPNKIIKGIDISLKNNKDNFFYLYGKKELIVRQHGVMVIYVKLIVQIEPVVLKLLLGILLVVVL